MVLTLAALIVMSSDWFQGVLEQRVVAALEGLTGGRVEIARFRFRPWLLQITLQGLVIHGSEPRGDPPLVSAREVDIGVRPDPLLRRRLRLRHVDIDSLRVRLRNNSQGITNLPGPTPPVSAGVELASLMDLAIGRLTLSHSALYWNDQFQPLDVESKDLAVLLSMTHGQYNGVVSSAGTTLRSRTWSTAPVTFNGRFELSHAKLSCSWFAWQTAGSGGEAVFSVLLRPQVEGSGSFRATTGIAALGRIFHAPQLRAGTVQLEGLAVYQGGSLSAQGRAQARQLTISTPAFPSLRLDAQASYLIGHHQIALNNLLVSVWGGTAQGSFTANFDGGPARFHLDTQVRRIRLDNALDSARTPPLLAAQLHPASLVDGALRASWSGQGEGLKADFDFALRAPAVTPRNTLPVSGDARGTFADEHGMVIHLEDAEISTPHSTVTARGTLTEKATSGPAGEPLALSVTTSDFEEWRPFFEALVPAPGGIPLELRSRAQFSGQLSGGAADPSLRGRVEMGRFLYHGWTWDHLAAVVSLSPAFLQITDGRADHRGSSLELNGSAQLQEWRVTADSKVRFSARTQRTPIEGLETVVNSNFPLRGLLTGNVDVEGTASDLMGSGTLRIDGGVFEGEPFDSFSGRLRVAKAQWKVENVLLVKNHGQLTGNLALEPERRFVFCQLTGKGFRLEDFQRLKMSTSTSLPKGGLDGSMSFDAKGQGTPEDFHLQSSWQFRNLSLLGTPLGKLDATLEGNGKQLILKGEDRGPGGDLHISMKANAEGDWPLEGEGDYSNLRIDPWIQAFFERQFGAVVTMSGSFHASGPLRAPEKISLESHTTEMAVNFPSVQWRNAQPVDLHYANGQADFSRFVVRGPSTELTFAGKVQIAGGITMAVTADGTANPTLLSIFDPQLQASGRSTLHLQLTGTPTQPLLNGTVGIQDMNLDYSGLPFQFSNLQGNLSLEGERVVISSLRGACGAGTVNLTGFATLAASPRFEVRAELGHVHIRYPPNFTSVFDGNLRLAGGVEQSQIQGDIVVRQMVLNENVNFISKIMESSSPVAEAPASINSPAASKVRLNVRVTSIPPVQLQTPNLRLTGDIDLRLQGTVQSPVQVGTIHFLSGETVFRGNRFTLLRGDMSMTNPFRTQTYLDLEAQTRVQNYDLTLDISGPFDRLKFSYRSDPPLANADIISLLALGYVPQEQVFATTGGNPSASIGASAILSEALSSQTTSRIQHLFGVSRIKIDPNIGVPGLGSGALVTVEQQVSHDLTLTYTTDTSYTDYKIIQFEWNISDKVSVLGIRDQNGVFGIEFRFRHRFR